MLVTSEKVTIDAFLESLRQRRVLFTSKQIKGVSFCSPHLSFLIDRFLKLSRRTFEKRKYIFLQLPVFVRGEDFLEQCRKIKDFSTRVFWGDPLKKEDLHVFNSTVEAQISSLLVSNEELLREGKKFLFIRQIGRYESGRTMPFWKERIISFFVEAQTLHITSNDLTKTINEMNEILAEIYGALQMQVFFIERFKENQRLKEYSARRLESVVMDPIGDFSILSSIYDLGDKFSRVYGLKVEGKYPTMLNFAFSARLFLLMLMNHSDELGLLYPSILDQYGVQILVVDDVGSFTKDLKKSLERQGIKYKISNIARTDWKREFGYLKEAGTPLVLVLKEDGSWLYQRINNSIKKLEDFSFTRGLDFTKLLKEHDNILKMRQAKFVEDNTFVYSGTNPKVLQNIPQKVIVTGLCSRDNCLTELKVSLPNWNILGHLLAKRQELNKCVICGKVAEYNILIGKKAKTEK